MDSSYKKYPVLNRERLLRVSGGNCDLIAVVVDAFATDVANQIDELGADYKAHGTLGMSARIHKLNGAVANVGGERLHYLLAGMENAFAQGDEHISSTEIDRIKAETEQLIALISEQNWE